MLVASSTSSSGATLSGFCLVLSFNFLSLIIFSRDSLNCIVDTESAQTSFAHSPDLWLQILLFLPLLYTYQWHIIFVLSPSLSLVRSILYIYLIYCNFCILYDILDLHGFLYSSIISRFSLLVHCIVCMSIPSNIFRNIFLSSASIFVSSFCWSDKFRFLDSAGTIMMTYNY